MKQTKFYTTENVQDYNNFINDHDLSKQLSNYETGYANGKFFIEISGNKDIIDQIERMSLKERRGTYKRTDTIKIKQSKYHVRN